MAKAKKRTEADVVEMLMAAHSLAKELFGAKTNDFAVEEIYDYLEVADAEEFVADLKRVIEHTKQIYKIETPSPEETFGVFWKIFPVEE